MNFKSFFLHQQRSIKRSEWAYQYISLTWNYSDCEPVSTVEHRWSGSSLSFTTFFMGQYAIYRQYALGNSGLGWRGFLFVCFVYVSPTPWENSKSKIRNFYMFPLRTNIFIYLLLSLGHSEKGKVASKEKKSFFTATLSFFG